MLYIKKTHTPPKDFFEIFGNLGEEIECFVILDAYPKSNFPIFYSREGSPIVNNPVQGPPINVSFNIKYKWAVSPIQRESFLTWLRAVKSEVGQWILRKKFREEEYRYTLVSCVDIHFSATVGVQGGGNFKGELSFELDTLCISHKAAKAGFRFDGEKWDFGSL